MTAGSPQPSQKEGDRGRHLQDLSDAALRGDERICTPTGDIELVNNDFDDEASVRVFDAMDDQRGVQAYLWGIPLVGFIA